MMGAFLSVYCLLEKGQLDYLKMFCAVGLYIY